MKKAKEVIGYYCDDIVKSRYLGQGISVGILDTGITLHPDFDNRILGFRDFVGLRHSVYDDSGHGTHVAGILAGSGRMSDGVYSGIAPEARLIIGKVLDEKGNGSVQAVLRGIQWILEKQQKWKIRIVNLSVGTQPGLNGEEEQRLLEAVEAMWDAGIVVVVSAGNSGPKEGTVAVPGNSRKVITVGAVDRTFRQGWSGVSNWDYSGRGPVGECILKPEVSAPGTQIMSCNGNYTNRFRKPYTMKSGTSMATPIVSGAIACLLSKYPDMSNVEVKLRLRERCVSGQEGSLGWGLLNVERLLQKGR